MSDLITLVKEFCDRSGIDRPTSVSSSSDTGDRQFMGLLNETLGDLLGRGWSWEKLQKEAVWSAAGTTDQGALAALAPYGFLYIVDDTLFNRTQRRRLIGPLPATQWQQNEALNFASPINSWRVWKQHFWIQPAPTAGHTMVFEYASNWSVLDPDAVTYKPRFTNDNDTCLFSDELLLAGLSYRWNQRKGFPFATLRQAYEDLVAQEAGQDNKLSDLHMDGRKPTLQPVIVIPTGSWNV